MKNKQEKRKKAIGLFSIIKEVIEADNVTDIAIVRTVGGGFYSMKVNGKKVRKQEGLDLIKRLTGIEMTDRMMYHSDEMQEILEKLKEQGIDAGAWEKDVA